MDVLSMVCRRPAPQPPSKKSTNLNQKDQAMVKKNALIALAAASVCCTPVFAEARFGDYVTLSGFGTVGVASSDNDKADFVRDGAPQGAGKKESWKVDSKLGLQANITANDWLSGTLQVLAEQRYEPGVKADLEWAFVKIKPMDGLSIRLGRTSPAMFMISDTRNVGYANTPVRMPNEVYSLAALKRLSGGDVSYTFGALGTSFTVSAMAGQSHVENVNMYYKAKNVRGVNLQWDTSYGNFRVGQVRTTNVVPDFGGPGITLYDPYKFSGVGYSLDNGKVVIGAEYVKRQSKLAPTVVDSDGWYVLGGYRFGNLLPYVSAAETKLTSGPGNVLNGKQTTYAMGMRWDFVSGAALKVQYERVDPKGTMGVSFPTPVPFGPPTVRDKTNVLSVVVDFVF